VAESWERLPGESSRAYSVFCEYMNLGPYRSLDKLKQKLHKSITKSVLARWSVKYKWVERASAYDDYIEKLKRIENEKAIVEMCERQAKIAMEFLEKVEKRLETLDPADLTPSELIRWLDIAVKVERLARGEPADISKAEVTTLPQIIEVVMNE